MMSEQNGTAAFAEGAANRLDADVSLKIQP